MADYVNILTIVLVIVIILIAIAFFAFFLMRLLRGVHKEGMDLKKQMDTGKIEDKKQKDREILFSESRHENVMDADYEEKK